MNIDGNFMSVGIYLPTDIFWRSDSIRKLVAEGAEGYYTLLPRHTDYISVLVPGILSLTSDSQEPTYFAVDHGALVKQGSTVNISTRNCVRGDDLESLAKIVEAEFLQLDDLEKKAKTALIGLEHSLLKRFAELRKG